MLVIGLTGGIGTGKSEVSKVLRELGSEIIDGDRVGHEVYLPNTAGWRDVVEYFGQEVLQPNGEIDRKKLGARVFSSPKDLEKLNAITWPKIRSMIKERLDKLRAQGQKVAVFEAALLIEAKLNDLADEVWVVIAPEDAVIRRIQQRNNLPEEAIRARIRSQLSNDERIKYAHIVIENSGDVKELHSKVHDLWVNHVKERLAANGST